MKKHSLAHYAEQNSATSGKREVILTMYLISKIMD